MDGRMDTVCLCRDPLLSTHLGWVKAFGFFIGRVKVVQPVVSGGDRVPVPRHTQQHVFEKSSQSERSLTTLTCPMDRGSFPALTVDYLISMILIKCTKGNEFMKADFVRSVKDQLMYICREKEDSQLSILLPLVSQKDFFMSDNNN
ncbi:hypothetical protein OPV22_001089 [Ensete ventricosum]|uniref:Uncharacterized protein n=1 Tax=Ensete ventricosum TaxID=4639 RepID=A0AAV8RVJ1_ENSVE|nr:hypothetical protein OPV22_001089 [Ensete ventricosum]